MPHLRLGRIGAATLLLAIGLLTTPAFGEDEPGAKPATQEAEIPWARNLEEAKKQAAKEDKDLLINFTGSDWCIWCMRLEGEVLSRAAFVDGAKKHFVFVFMDSPRDPELIKALVDVEARDQLKRDLGIDTYPNIVLATADGAPYARTGYQRGVGAAAFLKQVVELRSGGAKVKAMLAATSDPKALQAGLEVLARNILLGYPAYAPLLDAAEKADPDGSLGIKKLAVEERIRQLKAKEDAAVRAAGPQPGERPDWPKIAAALMQTKHLTGHLFMDLLFKTANWLIEEKQDGPAAKALLELAKRDPILKEHATADEIWAELSASAEKLIMAARDK